MKKIIVANRIKGGFMKNKIVNISGLRAIFMEKVNQVAIFIYKYCNILMVINND